MTWDFKGLFKRFLEAPNAGLWDQRSPAGRGRIRYNDTTKTFQASVDRGPYLDFSTGGGGIVAVDTVSDLSALDDTAIVDGANVEVNSVEDLWYLDKTSTRAADAITVAVTSSGTGRWIRRQLPSSNWATQTTWWISSGGNDENDGNTAGTPIRTHAELRRRIGHLLVRDIITVNLVGTIAEKIVCDFNCDFSAFGAFLYVGVRTQVTTAVITASTPHNNAAGSRAFGTLTFGVDVSAQEGRLLVAEDGAAAGATAWHVQPAAGGVNTCITGPFINAVNSEVFPANGNTIGFYDLTQITEDIEVRDTAFAGFFDVHVTGTVSLWGGLENTASLGRARFDGGVFCNGRIPVSGSASGDFAFPAAFSGALFRNFVTVLGGATFQTQVCMFATRFGNLTVRQGGYHHCLLTTGFVGQPGDEPVYVCEGFTDLNVGASIAFTTYGAGVDCLRSESGGTVRALGNLWGELCTAGGAGFVLTAAAFSSISYTAGNPPTFAPNADIEVGGVASTLGALPVTTAANFSGIVVDA